MLPKEVYDSRKVDRLYIPVPTQPPTPLAELVTAPLGLRVAALIIDEIAVIVLACLLIVIYAADGALENAESIWFLTWLTYYIVCDKSWGRTIGKKLVGLRVIDTQSQQRPSLGQAIGRQLAKFIDGLFFGIVALFSISRSPYSQRLGDRLASTVVIECQD